MFAKTTSKVMRNNNKGSSHYSCTNSMVKENKMKLFEVIYVHRNVHQSIIFSILVSIHFFELNLEKIHRKFINMGHQLCYKYKNNKKNHLMCCARQYYSHWYYYFNVILILNYRFSFLIKFYSQAKSESHLNRVFHL